MRWQTRIFVLAKERGWTKGRLARELGVAPSTLWRVRTGRVQPSRDLIWKAADLFHEAPSRLFWQERVEVPA